MLEYEYYTKRNDHGEITFFDLKMRTSCNILVLPVNYVHSLRLMVQGKFSFSSKLTRLNGNLPLEDFLGLAPFRTYSWDRLFDFHIRKLSFDHWEHALRLTFVCDYIGVQLSKPVCNWAVRVFVLIINNLIGSLGIRADSEPRHSTDSLKKDSCSRRIASALVYCQKRMVRQHET